MVMGKIFFFFLFYCCYHNKRGWRFELDLNTGKSTTVFFFWEPACSVVLIMHDLLYVCLCACVRDQWITGEQRDLSPQLWHHSNCHKTQGWQQITHFFFFFFYCLHPVKNRIQEVIITVFVCCLLFVFGLSNPSVLSDFLSYASTPTLTFSQDLGNALRNLLIRLLYSVVTGQC